MKIKQTVKVKMNYKGKSPKAPRIPRVKKK